MILTKKFNMPVEWSLFLGR